MEILKQFIPINYTKGGDKPKYIVIHNTDNPTADAQQHYKFWSTNKNANSSAHYVVDDKCIIQLVKHEDSSWHNGKKYGVAKIPECNNTNSIGIEICNHNGCDFNKAMTNAIWLVRQIMKETGIGVNNVITHKDSCAKQCPSTILKLNKWEWFKSEIAKPDIIQEKIDPNVFYRVICGSYNSKASAQKIVDELKKKGYDAFLDVHKK